MAERRTKRYKQKLEFSKIIAIIMLVIFILTFIAAWLVYIFQDKISTELLSFISIPLQTILSGYFVKSGFENVQKIKNDNEVDPSEGYR